MGNFKKVVIIQTGIEAFVQLVIGHRMKHFIIDPSRVFSVNNFSHQPEIFFHGSSGCTHLLHKLEIHYIGAVQTDSVNIKGINPITNHIK